MDMITDTMMIMDTDTITRYLINGWTEFTPSTNTQISYVSFSPGSCGVYLPNDPAVGPDPFNPVGEAGDGVMNIAVVIKIETLM